MPVSFIQVSLGERTRKSALAPSPYFNPIKGGTSCDLRVGTACVCERVHLMLPNDSAAHWPFEFQGERPLPAEASHPLVSWQLREWATVKIYGNQMLLCYPNNLCGTPPCSVCQRYSALTEIQGNAWKDFGALKDALSFSLAQKWVCGKLLTLYSILIHLCIRNIRQFKWGQS